MNIQIVICPACLKKYNAGVVATETTNNHTMSVQCPHCKYWVDTEQLKEAQPKLKELLK